MPERTPEDSHVSKIVDDALRYTAHALANWLDHPLDQQDVRATKPSLAVPHEVMCCCTMSVDLAIGSPRLTDAAKVQMRSAGLLLLGWRSREAAWLIDRSLNKTGTSWDHATWGELERSTIAETSNVVGCVFLNAIAEGIRDISGTDVSLIPDSPYIEHAYAGGWMDTAIHEVEERGEEKSQAWLASGTFPVANHSVNTHFAMIWRSHVWYRLTKLVGD